MPGITTRKLGRTNLDVTDMGFGTSPMGNLGRFVTEETCRDMIDAAWDAGVRFYDTAPLYGYGLSELRLGAALRWKRRDDFVLCTKVGRVLTPARRETLDNRPWEASAAFSARFDYSYDGAWRSLEDSLQRMALERVDILLIHDCDLYTHGPEQQPIYFRQAMDGAYRAMLEMREQGLVSAIGLGVNEWQVCQAALEQGDFDCFLLAGRYTLLEQESLDTFLPLCQQRQASVIVGGGLNSGILAKGARAGSNYNYAAAPDHILQRVSAIESVCKRHGVPLASAALHFVLGHPAVVSHVPGARSLEQWRQLLEWIDHPVPASLWQDLKREGLVREDAPCPD